MEQDKKYIEAMKLLDKKALEMKCELNELSTHVNVNGSDYEAILAIQYDFLCKVIWELEEKIGH